MDNLDSEIRTYPTETAEKRLNLLVRFFMAPAEIRTYTNLLYLTLAFPLGIFYFTFLITGLALGFGLTIIWIGLPILALVFAGSFGMAALERRLAIHLLDAKVPPMAAPRTGTQESLWKALQEFLSNPVTWKGMAFLFLKFPMGIVSFVMTVALLSASVALILTPVLYPWTDVYIGYWVVDSLPAALVLSAVGMMSLLISLNILNLLALGWREIAQMMLGSERFAVAPDATVTGSPSTPQPLPA